MKKTNLKKEDKNSTSLLKGVLTGLVGFGLGIGAKILYDEYKDKDKKKTTNEGNEVNENDKEDEKKENVILKEKKENKIVEEKETIKTSNKNLITATDDNEVIESMICPINQTIMNDPVVTPYGITYERTAIEDWLKKNDTDPIAKKHLTKDMLVTNYALKSVIKDYMKQESKTQKIDTIK